MDDRAKLILKYIKDGYHQKDLPEVLLKKEHIVISLSMIEKILKQVRLYYEANHMFHLAFILIEENYFQEKDDETSE